MAADTVGLDVEHRQSVDAARAAAAATLQAGCVKDVKAPRASIDLGVQGSERLGVVHLRQRPDLSAARAPRQPSRSCGNGGTAARATLEPVHLSGTEPSPNVFVSSGDRAVESASNYYGGVTTHE